MNAIGVNRDELIAALRRDAAGSLPQAAAIELLIAHGHWLRRDPFLTCITFHPADAAGPAVAIPAWAAVGVLLDYAEEGGLPDTDSQRAVLGVAASLGGGYRVDLRDVTLCDPRTVVLVSQASLTAGGAP
ncbi:MAG TPA: hypothetical protein VHH34_25305 [Pseudonocardiaceae bacterium]|nr:hypothetical protein [Pseudonocardiaceae bacterium]